MKKILPILLAVLFLFVPATILAEFPTTDASPEKILLYQNETTINKDGTADITEKIDYDFGGNQKHGIFRVIPMVYKPRYGNPHQDITVLSVTDENGNAYQTDIYGLETKTIKIGNPNELVTGVKTYLIKYKVTRIINNLAKMDEFYWNFIGDGWDVPIEKAQATVKLPGQFKNEEVRSQCFAGSYDSKKSCSAMASNLADGSISEFVYTEINLTAHQAMTTQIDLPDKTFQDPGTLEILFWKKPWYVALPIIAFLIFFSLWLVRGRDPKGRGTIIAQYDAPAEIEPAESSYILSERMDNKSLSAQIIYLATQGYIKIKRLEEKGLLGRKIDYELTSLKSIPANFKKYDLELTEALFGNDKTVKISDLKNDFGSKYQKIKKSIFKEIMASGYYRHSPAVVRILYILLTVPIFIFGLTLANYMATGLFGWISFVLTGVIAFVFGLLMPAKTQKAVLLKEYLLGLKEYIRVAEADRIKFHNAPAKNPAKFEELLPYAMIFGLEKEWAAQFKDIYKNPPDWYQGDFRTFNVVVFSQGMSDFSSHTSSTFTSVSGSSGTGGGGFSGGGGGGGGGGSW